jgi:MFS family permease
LRLEAPDNYATAGLKQILRALRHRNFRLYLSGQAISLTGTWMQQIAMGWLVYRLTSSAFLLGVVGFAGQIPALLLMSVAGVLADRWNCRRMLLVTQALAMLQAAAVATLAITGLIEVWHIIVLAVFLGAVNAFDMPTRHTFLVQMVEDRNDLPSGIALHSSMFNAARLLGPSIAGIIVAAWNEGGCFLLNAISYIAVLVALYAMRVPPRPEGEAHPSVFDGLKDGVRYVLGTGPIKAVLLLVALVSFVGMPYAVLMPVFARDVLHGGARTLGFLVASSAAGSIIGAAYLASRRTAVGLEKLIPVGLSAFGVAVLGFSYSRVLWLSMPMLVCAGCGMMTVFASCNTLVQTVVDDSKRGRVMSLYTLSFMGPGPFGVLLAGALAHRIGAPLTVAIYGAACLVAVGLYLTRLPLLSAALHRTHVRLGLVPEVVAAARNPQPETRNLLTPPTSPAASPLPACPSGGSGCRRTATARRRGSRARTGRLQCVAAPRQSARSDDRRLPRRCQRLPGSRRTGRSLACPDPRAARRTPPRCRGCRRGPRQA